MIEIKGKEIEGINPYAIPGIRGYEKKGEVQDISLTYDDVTNVVCNHMGLDRSVVWEKDRYTRMMMCRRLIVFFSNKYVEGSKSDIARYLRCHHTTILHHLKMLGNLYDTEENVRDLVEKIDFKIKLKINKDMAEKKQNTIVASLNKLPAIKVADDPSVHKKFVSLYKQVHGSDKGELVYAAEKFHFQKLIQESSHLQKCTGISLYGAFMDVAVQGLSVDPTRKLCYVVPYGNKATLQISGYGELQLRVDYGQVKHVDKPVIVYGDKDGNPHDYYKESIDKTGKKVIEYEKKRPLPKDALVIASFLRIVRNDDSIEIVTFDKEDFERWRSASKSPNSSAWTTHYPAMIATKTIKHAFNTYPKLKLKGQHSVLESDVDENTEDIDYGLVDEETGEVVPVTNEEEKKEPEPFGGKEKKKKEETVSVETDDDYEGY